MIKKDGGKTSRGGETTPQSRPKKGLQPAWKPGESGNPNGRPKGSRHKLSAAFIEALHESFEKNGDAVIETVMREQPCEYLRIIASIVPKQFGLEEGSENAFLQVWTAISNGTA